jgi:hypothetical protein
MPLSLTLSLLAAVLVLALFLRVEYRLWREATERERFMLALKEASTPARMDPEDMLRLRRLRAPFWAVWRWLLDLWRAPSFSRRGSRRRQ